MVKTVRFRDEETGSPRLGVWEGAEVYDLTAVVPRWTDPLSAWEAARAFGLDAEVALRQAMASAPVLAWEQLVTQGRVLPPIAAEEVWAAGVTYERSREARNTETKLKDSVYDRVYDAERPELFFKATERRLTAPFAAVGLRSDSSWMVPEPELAVAVTRRGDIVGWTLGNDMSSRDIEGENPLYLPQAKIFNGSCSIGPALLWHSGEVDPFSWTMSMRICRQGQEVYRGETSIRTLRRPPAELIQYLIRDNAVPDGTVLLTGTGIVPPDEFSLQAGDVIDIEVPEIGILRNSVAG